MKPDPKTILAELLSQIKSGVGKSSHDFRVLYDLYCRGFDHFESKGESLSQFLQASARNLIEVLDEDDRALEDTTLEEYQHALETHDVYEPRIRIEGEFSEGFASSLSPWLELESSHAAFRYPYVTSASMAINSVLVEYEQKSHSTIDEGPRARLLPQFVASLRERLAVAGLITLKSTESVYEQAGLEYLAVTSGGMIIHFARTPGILDPEDYRVGYRQQLFQRIQRSNAGSVFYVCAAETTAEDISERVAKRGRNEVVREIAKHLEPFLECSHLQIWFSNLPGRMFKPSGNVAVVTEDSILRTRRQNTRIATGWRVGGRMLKLLQGVKLWKLPVSFLLPGAPKDILMALNHHYGAACIHDWSKTGSAEQTANQVVERALNRELARN